jgi:hypothetical protein
MPPINIKQRLAAPLLPITPTADANGAPTCCAACGGLAFGIGRYVGTNKDPSFLCKNCIVAVGDLTKLDRLSIYEVKALDNAVDAVGEYLDTIGIYDLSLMDDLNRRMIVKAAVMGFAQGVRDSLRDAPF